jgi:hypothetical protein
MRQPSALGFLVRHPLAIGVDVQGRSRHAFGPVLSDEVEQLVRNVRAIRGVQGVVNQLDVHTHANGIPELQGAKPKPAGEPLVLCSGTGRRQRAFLSAQRACC